MVIMDMDRMEIKFLNGDVYVPKLLWVGNYTTNILVEGWFLPPGILRGGGGNNPNNPLLYMPLGTPCI